MTCKTKFCTPVCEVEEPRVVLVRAQGGEPHLPVQARLVRQAEDRRRIQLAWVTRQRDFKMNMAEIVL